MTHITRTDHVTAELLDAAIVRNGFAVIPVGYGSCSVPGCCGPAAAVPWTYTIGLSQVGAAELVLLGLDQISAQFAVSWVASETLAGHRVNSEQCFDLRDTAIKLVDVPDEWLLTDPDRMAAWFADRQRHARPSGLPRLRQVVWADSAGRFPDHPSYRPTNEAPQPLLLDDPFSVPHRAPRAVRRATRPQRRIA